MPFYFRDVEFPTEKDFEKETKKKLGARSKELKDIGATLRNLHADINSLPRATDPVRRAPLYQSIDSRLTQLANQVRAWQPDGTKATAQRGKIVAALGQPGIALFRTDMRLIQQGPAPALGTAAQPSTSSTAPPYPQPQQMSPQMPPQFQMHPQMQPPPMPQGSMTPQYGSPPPTAWTPMPQHSPMHPAGSTMRVQPNFGGQPPDIPPAFQQQQHTMAPVQPFAQQPMSPQRQQYQGMPPQAHGVAPRASAYSQPSMYSQESAPRAGFDDPRVSYTSTDPRGSYSSSFGSARASAYSQPPMYSQESAPRFGLNDPRASYTPTELRDSYGSDFDLGRDSRASGGREISMVAGSSSYGSPISPQNMSYPNLPWGSSAAYGASPPQSGHWSWGAQPVGQQPNWGAESMHSGPEMEYGSSRASMDTIDKMKLYAQEVGSNVDRLEAQRQPLLPTDQGQSDRPPSRQPAASTSYAPQASSSSQPFGSVNSPPAAQAAGYSPEESESYVPPTKGKARASAKKSRR